MFTLHIKPPPQSGSFAW